MWLLRFSEGHRKNKTRLCQNGQLEKAVGEVRGREKAIVTPSPVQQAAAAYFGVELEALCAGGTRSPAIIASRHVGQYLERELAGRSFTEIGALYNLRDHTGALASFRHVTARIVAEDESYTSAIMAISSVVKAERAKKTETAHVFAAMSCPTCGAPVIDELRRQIATLTAKVAELGGGVK